MHSAQIVSAMHSDENSGDAQRCQNSAVKCRCGVPLCDTPISDLFGLKSATAGLDVDENSCVKL